LDRAASLHAAVAAPQARPTLDAIPPAKHHHAAPNGEDRKHSGFVRRHLRTLAQGMPVSPQRRLETTSRWPPPSLTSARAESSSLPAVLGVCDRSGTCGCCGLGSPLRPHELVALGSARGRRVYRGCRLCVPTHPPGCGGRNLGLHRRCCRGGTAGRLLRSLGWKLYGMTRARQSDDIRGLWRTRRMSLAMRSSSGRRALD
jgi:hypothetical protein